MKQQVVFYGAGRYPRESHATLFDEFEPLCFCDRKARPNEYLFGLPVLLPDALFNKFPDAMVLITMGYERKIDTQEWLTKELGLPENRILNYENVKKAHTCRLLENHALLQLFPKPIGTRWLFCADEGFSQNTQPQLEFNLYEQPCKIVNNFQILKNRLKSSIYESGDCECSGCPMLREQYVSSIQKPLTGITILLHHGCNINCFYCKSYKGETIVNTEMHMLRGILDELEHIGLINSSTLFISASGEITTNPQRKELLSLLSNYNCYILSNCTVYDQIFADHLALGKTLLNCSVDAGTRETYAKVKGKDAFIEVCNNLKLYSIYAKVELKYIFLPGYNDNESDVDGFIKMAQYTNAHTVQIAKNYFDKALLTEHTLSMIERFITNAKSAKIPITIRDDGHFSTDDITRLSTKLKE